MDIIIYCFIVLLWKSTLIYKTPKETATSAVCRFSKYCLVHKCRNQDCHACTLYSKRIYLTRSLSITATKTVDCSFIKAEHSTQASSKNISIEKILVLPNNSPYHHLFHKVSICHLLNSHKFLHIYCLQRMQCIIPSKNTVFESCKTISLLPSVLFSCSVL
jgi:hypothetical protein